MKLSWPKKLKIVLLQWKLLQKNCKALATFFCIFPNNTPKELFLHDFRTSKIKKKWICTGRFFDVYYKSFENFIVLNSTNFPPRKISAYAILKMRKRAPRDITRNAKMSFRQSWLRIGLKICRQLDFALLSRYHSLKNNIFFWNFFISIFFPRPIPPHFWIMFLCRSRLPIGFKI